MAFFELHDIKRDRVPYQQKVFWHMPFWSPRIDNTLLMNLKTTSVGCIMATFMVILFFIY